MSIFGVSFDTVEDNRRFAEKFGFPFLLLSDGDRAMALAYGAASSAGDRTPRRISYVIDEEGRIAGVLEKVDPANHTADILALLG